MEIRNPFGYKSAFALLRVVTILSIVLLVIGLVFGYSLMSKQVAEANRKMVIIDRDGQVYEKGTINYRDGRVYEYEDQARNVFRLWYGLDEFNYDRNVESALKILGNCGKDMLEKYIQSGLKNTIVQKNLVMIAEVEGVEIDINSIPVKGNIWGKQIVKRGEGEASRWIRCEFIVIDTDRSRENPHGCKLDNWRIVEAKNL